MSSQRLVAALAAAALASLASSAHAAGFNQPILFSQAGTVELTLDVSTGGFDHYLELANGFDQFAPLGPPIMTLTENGGIESEDVLGFTPANIGDTVSLGAFAAGEEIIFRLTNVTSVRMGATSGGVESQVWSGSASLFNPAPDRYYTLVEVIDEWTLRVYFEDLFAIDPEVDDPLTEFFTFGGGYDVGFTLTLTPTVIPIPAALPLFLTGLGWLGFLRQRRSGQAR